jgi:F-type H+-transporting ATPase subunit f
LRGPEVKERGRRGVNGLTQLVQAIGGAADAARMQRVVAFYEKLPRGPAPDPKPKGFLQWYQFRYMGKNPSAMRMSTFGNRGRPWMGELTGPTALVHLIGGVMLIGYIQNYYFHLRE